MIKLERLNLLKKEKEQKIVVAFYITKIGTLHGNADPNPWHGSSSEP